MTQGMLQQSCSDSASGMESMLWELCCYHQRCHVHWSCCFHSHLVPGAGTGPQRVPWSGPGDFDTPCLKEFNHVYQICQSKKSVIPLHKEYQYFNLCFCPKLGSNWRYIFFPWNAALHAKWIQKCLIFNFLIFVVKLYFDIPEVKFFDYF